MLLYPYEKLVRHDAEVSKLRIHLHKSSIVPNKSESEEYLAFLAQNIQVVMEEN